MNRQPTSAAVVTSALLIALSGIPVAADPLPSRVGQCAQTVISEIGHRLSGSPGSGSAVRFADGGGQVSYDEIPPIARSRPGDTVNMCLISVPQGCPPGDDRGRVYKTTNLRTRETWTLPDSQHSCGGA